jgi:hypothetical protein
MLRSGSATCLTVIVLASFAFGQVETQARETIRHSRSKMHPANSPSSIIADCFSFQQFWNDQLKNHAADWYHKPFPPEARQCWNDYMIPLTAAGDKLDQLDLHDDFVRIYAGIQRCEDAKKYERVIALQTQLDIATLNQLFAYGHQGQIVAALSALNASDIALYMTAIAKYSNDVNRYFRLLQKWPDILDFWKVVVPANVKRNLECLKHPFQTCE